LSLVLRDYQVEAVAKTRAALVSGKRRPLIYSPTGSGKTEIACAIIKAAEAKGKRVLFVANRIQLVKQASARLSRSSIRHGIVQGQNSTWTTSQILVCSIQTLAARGWPETIDLIIIDEAHGVAGSKAYRDLIMSAKVPTIGLSATPFTRGLGKHYDELGGALFDEMVVATTIRDLIDAGFLVDCDIYAPSAPDLKGVKITAGDYNEKQLGERVDKAALVGDIVTHWQKLAQDTQTVCFATNIAHSMHIVEQFKAAGVRAEHLDCYTDDTERAAIIRRLESGDTRVISNVAVLAEGFDCPVVSTVICARPTKSLARWIQMVGRALRPFHGKDKALILDHSGTALRLGFPTDDLPLELNDGRVKDTTAEEDQAREEALPKLCEKCSFLKPPKVWVCPSCGHSPERQNKVASAAGELKKIERKKATMQDKQAVWSQLYQRAKEKGYNPHWADHKYREYFGCWPKGMVDTGAPMTDHIKNFLTSQAIRHAKSPKPSHSVTGWKDDARAA
jgi:superfamily II DNA or RNA helicase